MRLATGMGVLLAGVALAWLAARLPGASRRRDRPGLCRRFYHPDGACMLVLTAFTLLFFWPVLVAGYVFPRGGGDLWGQLYPVWSFVARQVRQGTYPLWDPLLLAGDPILSEAQYGLFNPLNWFLFLQSPPSVALVLWRGMTSVVLAGAGMYLFLTRSPGLRLRRTAGLLGGVAYMLSDPFVVHLGHPQINDTMAWLPWSLLALDGALATRRKHRVALAGVPVALMVLAGHGQMALYGLIALALYGLWRSLATPVERPWMGRLARLALVALVGLALAAPVLLPAMERMPWTNRALVPEEQRRGYEFAPALIADTLAPYIHGRGANGWWPALDRVETAYAGAVTLFLAVLGLAAGGRRGLFWAGLGGLALVFALGHQAPLYRTAADWPLFADLWKTGRAIFLTAFALAVLAALGLQALLEGGQDRLTAAWRWSLVAGGAVLGVLAPHLLRGVPAERAYPLALANLRLVAALAVGVAGLAWAWRRWRTAWATAGLLLLLTGELVALGALVEVDKAPPLPVTAAAPEHAGALAFLRSDPGWFRVDAQDEARHLWSPETLQLHGFETLQGSGNPLSLWPFEQFYWTQPSKDAPGYRLLGAKYIVMPKGAPPPGANIWPVFTEDPLIDIHLNTLALPRAWLVYRSEPVGSYADAWQRARDPGFLPEQVAVVENGPRLDGAGSGRIEVAGYNPNELRLVVHTDAPALLVLSDVYYPGWQAYVDGGRVPIYRTDVTFRGVEVPAGSHDVLMRFRPRSFQVGSAFAVLGLGAVLLGVLPGPAWGKLRRPER